MIRIAALLAFVLMAGPAAADPATALIGYLGGQAALGTVGVALVRIGVSIGLTLLANAISGTQRSGASRAGGIVTDSTTAGETRSQTFILGRYATAGNLVAPLMAHGGSGLATPNAYRTTVLDLSDAPVTAIREAIVDGRVHAFDGAAHGEFGAGVTESDFVDFLFRRAYSGGQTVADTYLRGRYGSDPDRPWESDMVGLGIAYAVYIARIRAEPRIWSGEPSILTVVDGIKLYDPREDTSVGGDGPQRWASPSTWEFTRNPIVMVYNILRGITLPDGQVYGGGHTAADLPLDVWAAAMTACDDAGFEAGLEVRIADDAPLDVIDELLKACSGQVVDVGGTVYVQAGEPELPALYITDDMILRTSGQDLDPFPGLEQVFNGVRASYPSPDDLWQSRATPLRVDAAALAADGVERIAELALNAVTTEEQAQRLCAAYLADNRRFRRHTITLPPVGQLIRPLQTVAWTSARNGYDEKLFEVVSRGTDPRTLSTTLGLRERDPADYDWSPDTDLLPVTAPPLTIAPAPDAAVPDFEVAGFVITDADGNPRRPAIRIAWSGAGFIGSALAWELRPVEDVTASVRGTVADVASGSALLIEGVVGGEVYQVRARFVGGIARPIWTAWITVTAPLVPLTGPDLSDEIRDAVETLNEWIDGGVTELPVDLDGIRNDALERLEDALAQAGRIRLVQDRVAETIREATELAARAAVDGAEIRRTLAAQIESTAARFDETISVLAGSEFAAVQRLTTLEASTADLGASIVLLEQAIVDGDDALAQLVAEISVGSAVQFDHARIWYFDSGVESWTGVPDAPAVTAPGWLRPAAASYVVSPTDLGVNAVRYSQLRARLRRVGAPTWQGWLWWRAAAEGWNAARRVTITEPTWDDGIGLITATPGWTGTVDVIRVELTSGADSSNYVEIDWIAVGRPAPGASSADLVTESLARIAEGEALASQITVLDASLTTLSGTVTGQAGAISTLGGRVTDTEDGIDAAAWRLDALEATVEDPTTGLAAVATAVDELTARVTTTEGSVVSEATQVRGLRSTVQTLGGRAIDAAARGLLDDQLLRTYTASASEQLSTRVDLTEEQVTVLAQAVTLLQAAIPGLATADALSALTTTVTTQGGLLSALSSSTTALEATVPTLATASALSTLAATVTTQGDEIDAVSGAVTEIQSTIPDLATAEALSSLSTQVNNTKGATADALLALGATLVDTTAETRFRMTVEATPAGASARIGLKATATGDEGDARTAALFLDAMPGDVSRVVVQADRFAVVNGANTASPFIIVSGQPRLNPAQITLNGDVTVDGSFTVTGSMIQNGAASRSRLLSPLGSLVNITATNAESAQIITTTATGVLGQFQPFVYGADGRALNPIELDLQILAIAPDGEDAISPFIYCAFQAFISGTWTTVSAASSDSFDPLRLRADISSWPTYSIGRFYMDGSGINPSTWSSIRLRAFRFSEATEIRCGGAFCAVRQINK